jgi:hypothetical protein
MLNFGSVPATGGTFNFIGSTNFSTSYTSYLSGTGIPFGTTVSLDPSNANVLGNMTVSLPTTFTNAGTLTLAAAGENHNINVNGALFTNTGTMNIDPGPTADGQRILNVFMTNTGGLNINATTTITQTFTNSGVVSIAPGRTLTSSSGLFTQVAGLLNIQGNLSLASDNLQANGGIINVPGIATVENFNGNRPTNLTIPGGTFTIQPRITTTTNAIVLSSLSITAGGSLNLTNNDLAIGYSSPSVRSSILSSLISGYAHGAWTGSGIISSTATSVRGSTLGYIDTGSQMLIDYTWIGDANLDGVVNTSDLSAMSPTGTTWAAGDFNYDGKVNADDFALFMLGSVSSGGTNISTTLPEPSMMVVPSFAFLLSVRRFRKSAWRKNSQIRTKIRMF